MATIHIDDFIDYGTKGWHAATSYQIATDSNFNNILDESIWDEVNITSWNTPLEDKNNPGTFFTELSSLHARVRVHIIDRYTDENGNLVENDVSTPWFVVPTANQNDQPIIVTNIDGTETVLNSLDIGLN